MTYENFINKWLNKTCDYDGFYGGQCVDLFRMYVKEVLNYPQPIGVIGAKDFWYNYTKDANLNKYYTKITNKPTNVPNKGDVILWDYWSGNKYGHVSIYIGGDVNKFMSLDQNYPVLSKVTKTQHNYTNPKVLGWLRPKGIASLNMLKDTIIDFNDFEGKRHSVGWYVDEWAIEKKSALKLTTENKELLVELERLRKENDGLRTNNAKISTENTEITGKNIALMNEAQSYKNKAEELEGKIDVLVSELDTSVQENKRCADKLKSCKKSNLEDLTLGDFISWVGLKLGVKK